MKKIILASGSPRRRELMREAGLTFEIEVSQAEEEIGGLAPDETVRQLSLIKASDIADRHAEDCIVIGADTVVAYKGSILGKPASEEEAYEMISMLEGETHQVYTGVTLISKCGGRQKTLTFHEETDVTFYPMSREEISDYIKYGKPYDLSEGQPDMLPWKDKAGGYGIQDGFGKRYIKCIKGDYYTVVGLPISRLCHELKHIAEGE